MFNHFYLAALILLLLISGLFLLIKRNKFLQRFSIDLDIGGIIYGGIVAVYSILLAFIVVIVWEQYQNTGDRIQEESSKVFNLYRASYAFPDSTTGKKIRTTVIISDIDPSLPPLMWNILLAGGATI